MSPEDLAELAYWHLSLGDDPLAWRRFWAHLNGLIAGEPAHLPEFSRA